MIHYHGKHVAYGHPDARFNPPDCLALIFPYVLGSVVFSHQTQKKTSYNFIFQFYPNQI